MLVVKRYSHQTLMRYRGAFARFLSWCGPRKPLDLSQQDIVDYLAARVSQERISESYQNVIINAIKFYFEMVEGKPRTLCDTEAQTL